MAGLITASIVVAAPANATVSNGPGSGSFSTSDTVHSRNTVRYSDQDVVDFFVFSSGPAAIAHPEILENLGTEPQPEPKRASLAAATSALMSVDPDFHENVTLAVQAGDPYLAESALKQLVDDVQAYQAKHVTKNMTAVSTQSAGQGAVWAFTTIWLSAAVAVTALAVVSVAGIFLALYQNPGDSSDLAKQEFAANIATSLSL